MPRRSSPSPLLNPPVLIIILPVIALLLLFLALPPLFSITSHRIIKPHAVKKSWDSLNIFLVLFAILCGVFSRRNNDDESTGANGDGGSSNIAHSTAPHVFHSKTEHSVPDQSWLDQFPDQKIYNPPLGTPGRLRRSVSSYPDLRQESLWENNDDRFRFFDDFASEYIHRRQRSRFEESNVREIHVDTFVLLSSPPSPSPRPAAPKSPAPPPPPPPPPPPATRPQQRRTHKTVPRKEKADEAREEFREDYSNFRRIKYPPPTPPPPPPPPPPVARASRLEKKHVKSERKIKMVLASIYNQRKRKKRQRTKSSNDDSLHSPTEQPNLFTGPPPSPPPPPPPPPPPSVFLSLFRKGSKSKKVHSFSGPPPPPPPPPPPSVRESEKSSKRKSQPPPPPAQPTPPRRHSATTGRPPLPTRANNLCDENVNGGGQSPLIPMPPPPPPPPFGVQGFRFVMKGGYVKIRSAHSSRCSSPELEEVDRESTATVNVMDGGDGSRGGAAFCPSPDVNVKADSFIARLRDEWRLEKINSLRERSKGQGPG